MAKEVFGASIVLKDNVSSVFKQAKSSASGFRRDIEAAKKELEKLDKQKVKEKELRLKNSTVYKGIEEIKKKMKPLEKKVVNVIAKTEKATEKLKGIKNGLKSLKDKTVHVITKTAGGIGKVGAGIGKVAMTSTVVGMAAVTAATTAAVSKGIEFEAQMAHVGTLLDGDVKGKLNSMGNSLKKVSIDTGASTSDLTDGLYQTVSAFGESADSVKQLEIAAKGAKAGGATTTDAINLLSAVTKGYGDTSAESVQKVSDLAFQTVKLGQTSFPELASSMGSVVPLASTLKVKEEELFGAMATLTGVTGNTAEVSTQLKATMQGFLSPSESMSKALKKMGYSSGAAALESESLESILGKLKDSVQGDEIAFANMFSSVEAKNAVLALTGTQAQNFTEKTKAMKDAAGASETAFKQQTSSVKEMASKIKNAGSVMLTSLGEKALPYIATALEKVMDKLPELSTAFDSAMSFIEPIITTVKDALINTWISWQPVLTNIGTKFQEVMVQLQPFFTSMMENFQSIMPYVQPVVTTLVNVVASILPVVAPIFAGISSVVAEVFPVVSTIISEVGEKISTVFNVIGEHAGTIRNIFESVAPAISTVLSTAWDIISPILDIAVSGFEILLGVVEKCFPTIEAVISGVWDTLEPVFSGIASGIKAVGGAVDKFKGWLGIGGGSSSSGGVTTKIGHNATGTNYWRGGWTEVGEHGPEYVNLPSGSKVYSNTQTNNMISGQSSGSGVNIHIAHMEVRKEDDIDAVAQVIIEKIKDVKDDM